MNKIEHEGMGTCARTEIGQDADDANQKIKWFLKVHKTCKIFAKHIFNFLSSKFLFRFTFYKFFDFCLPENES